MGFSQQAAALFQYMNGVTDQLHSIKTLNPNDLNKEMVKNITFYPPGGTALISLFTIVGVPLGSSAKVVTWLSFLSGVSHA